MREKNEEFLAHFLDFIRSVTPLIIILLIFHYNFYTYIKIICKR
jgi:hypothetical protein